MECEHMAEQLHPEDIYQTLEYEIVTLKIKPGETISENQLCKRFGISRTPRISRCSLSTSGTLLARTTSRRVKRE